MKSYAAMNTGSAYLIIYMKNVYEYNTCVCEISDFMKEQ